MKKYFYCEVDHMGQRSGIVYGIELADNMVREEDGLLYCNLDVVDGNGYNTLLYKDEETATRCALS